MTITDDQVLDLFADCLAGEPCTVSGLGLAAQTIPVSRWIGDADASDRTVLAHCGSPTIDLGCGPGRMSEQLARDGVDVLGVDVAAEAVAQARARGVNAIHGDVFGALPREGAWGTALLADGNIGIGGDPVRLLRRVRRLLAPHGQVVVDLAPAGAGLTVGLVRIHAGSRTSQSFPWAVVGADAVADVAAAAGLSVRDVHEYDGRWFAVLVRKEIPDPCLS
ncbi:MAG TPA: methyltransferase domain-containing protein [Nocardioidaceae bacterium]|jgi:SAM-dependent methyltransferase|nr:methyltransferase domain-containing protein [Nocardioidaceae bacterium]